MKYNKIYYICDKMCDVYHSVVGGYPILTELQPWLFDHNILNWYYSGVFVYSTILLD